MKDALGAIIGVSIALLMTAVVAFNIDKHFFEPCEKAGGKIVYGKCIDKDVIINP